MRTRRRPANRQPEALAIRRPVSWSPSAWSSRTATTPGDDGRSSHIVGRSLFMLERYKLTCPNIVPRPSREAVFNRFSSLSLDRKLSGLTSAQRQSAETSFRERGQARDVQDCFLVGKSGASSQLRRRDDPWCDCRPVAMHASAFTGAAILQRYCRSGMSYFVDGKCSK